MRCYCKNVFCQKRLFIRLRATLGGEADSAPSRFSALVSKHVAPVTSNLQYPIVHQCDMFSENLSEVRHNSFSKNGNRVASCQAVFASKRQHFKRLRHLQFLKKTFLKRLSVI